MIVFLRTLFYQSNLVCMLQLQLRLRDKCSSSQRFIRIIHFILQMPLLQQKHQVLQAFLSHEYHKMVTIYPTKRTLISNRLIRSPNISSNLNLSFDLPKWPMKISLLTIIRFKHSCSFSWIDWSRMESHILLCTVFLVFRMILIKYSIQVHFHIISNH